MIPPFLTGSQQKVLNHITNEWTCTMDIAHWCGYTKKRHCVKLLGELKEMGAIECKRDLLLNKSVWRIKQGGFVLASELKGEVL